MARSVAELMHEKNVRAKGGTVLPATVSMEGDRRHIERELAVARQKLEYLRLERRKVEDRVLGEYSAEYAAKWRDVLLSNAGLSPRNANLEDADLVHRIAALQAMLTQLDEQEGTPPAA